MRNRLVSIRVSNRFALFVAMNELAQPGLSRANTMRFLILLSFGERPRPESSDIHLFQATQ